MGRFTKIGTTLRAARHRPPEVGGSGGQRPPDIVPGTYQPFPGAPITLPVDSSYDIFLLHLPYSPGPCPPAPEIVPRWPVSCDRDAFLNREYLGEPCDGVRSANEGLSRGPGDRGSPIRMHSGGSFLCFVRSENGPPAGGERRRGMGRESCALPAARLPDHTHAACEECLVFGSESGFALPF